MGTFPPFLSAIRHLRIDSDEDHTSSEQAAMKPDDNDIAWLIHMAKLEEDAGGFPGVRQLRQRALCHCGQPLHYTNPTDQARVQQLVDQLGANVLVTVSGRTWCVQRHYIALHGISASELPYLGFPEMIK